MKEFINISSIQIEECLIKLNYNEQKAHELATKLEQELTNFVPASYQSEVDYYLTYLVPSKSPIGIRLAGLMLLHFNNFFEALTTLALE